MKRFFNTIVLLVLMFAGPLALANAWIWLVVHAGWLKTLVFAGLLLFASVMGRVGPASAARFAGWRLRVALARQEGRAL